MTNFPRPKRARPHVTLTLHPDTIAWLASESERTHEFPSRIIDRLVRERMAHISLDPLPPSAT